MRRRLKAPQMSRITSIEEKMQIYLSETHIELVKEVRAFAEEVIPALR